MTTIIPSTGTLAAAGAAPDVEEFDPAYTPIWTVDARDTIWFAPERSALWRLEE